MAVPFASMTADDKIPEGFTLKRWSQRKLAAARAAEAPPAVATPAAPVPGAPADDTSAVPGGTAPRAIEAPALPPIESLTIESDFAAFLQPKVDEALKRQALKKLFGDPHFNVMDGLDVYIDDYSKPDPLSPELVKQLVQGRYIFDPPQTRVSDQGFVEDVPMEQAAAAAPCGETEAAPQSLPEAPVMETAAPPAPATTAGPEAAPIDGDIPAGRDQAEPPPR